MKRVLWQNEPTYQDISYLGEREVRSHLVTSFPTELEQAGGSLAMVFWGLGTGVSTGTRALSALSVL
jgi:hypothetical protein